MPPQTRRALLRTAASVAVAGVCPVVPTRAAGTDVAASLAALETASGGRLGVAALDTASGAVAGCRIDERFAFCSTFKVLAAAAILKRSMAEPGLLEHRIVYSAADLVPYSPVTRGRAGDGMTVADICAAALQMSDNTAANLMLRLLGGPAAVTSFARAIGDDMFRLDREETALNAAVPGDPRDTSTPRAMMADLQGLTLGHLLGAAERDKLVAWMRGATTGANRIRAGVPAGWTVADKTGTGDYGSTNDIAVIWPPGRPPIVLAIYFTQADKDATPREDVVAQASRIVVAGLG